MLRVEVKVSVRFTVRGYGKYGSPTAHIHKHSLIRRGWFDVHDNMFSCMPNKPDIVVVEGSGLLI
jgi:hypothetical protein